MQGKTHNPWEPTRLECQEALLGLGLHDALEWDIARQEFGLSRDHFDGPGHLAAYDFLVGALGRRERAIDLRAFCHEVAQAIGDVTTATVWASQLTNAGAFMRHGCWRYWANYLLEHCAREQATKLMGKIEQASKVMDHEGAQAAARMLADVTAEAGSKREPIAIAALIRDWYQALEGHADRPATDSGLGAFRRLSSRIGGLLPGEMLLVGGPTSVGKSSFAKSMALGLIESGVPVGIVSLEDPRDTWITRLVADVASVDPTQLRLGGISAGQWSAIISGVSRLSAMSLTLAASRVGAWTAETACGAMRRLVAAGARFVIVDYLQCIYGDGRSRHVDLSYAMAAIKGTAADLGVPFVLLTQLSREGIKSASDSPPLWAIKETGDAENQAEAVAYLWCNQYDAHQNTAHVTDCIALHVMKAKNGRKGVIPLTWDAKRLAYAEAPVGSH